MFHAAGTFHALLCLWVGARQVILPGFDAAQVLDSIERERATVLFGVPTMLAAMLEEQRVRRRDLSSLRLLGFGAAPASSSLLRRVHEALPNTELVSMYGATELAPMGTTIEHFERYVDDERVRSAGRAIPGVRLRIVSEVGRDLAPREIGEVAIQGPNVMRGYWNKPQQTAEVLREGWYFTGDLGYLDEHGCLYLVDRAKDMIISGGENVYSSEVEEVLYRHPAVLECAVFGVPDKHWGEAVRAAVVLRPGMLASAEELTRHCRASLGGYKVPKAIDLHREALPKSGAGKILKRELRAPFWAGRERGIHGTE
jgi:long-chain acyl-CoA synthetase